MSWLSQLFTGADGPTIRTLEGRDLVADTSDVFTIPMVQTCRQLISDTVSSFTLYAEDSNGDRIVRTPLILEAPSPVEPLGDFLERLVNDMTRYGHGWLYVTARDDNQNPIAVELVSPRRVTAEVTANGQYIGRVIVDGRQANPQDIIQVPMFLDDGPIGLAPLDVIRDALVQLNAAYLFAASMFGNGATPNYALVSPTRLPPAQADALMTAWRTARGENRPALLTGDLSLETFSGQTAAEVQLQKQLDYFDSVIARVMQIPPTLVNAVANSSLTYSTTRDEYRRALISINTGYLHRLETAFTRLLPQGQTCKFDSGDLTRLDESEQLDNTIKAYQAGLISLQEARTTIGRDPNGTVIAPPGR